MSTHKANHSHSTHNSNEDTAAGLSIQPWPCCPGTPPSLLPLLSWSGHPAEQPLHLQFQNSHIQWYGFSLSFLPVLQDQTLQYNLFTSFTSCVKQPRLPGSARTWRGLQTTPGGIQLPNGPNRLTQSQISFVPAILNSATDYGLRSKHPAPLHTSCNICSFQKAPLLWLPIKKRTLDFWEQKVPISKLWLFLKYNHKAFKAGIILSPIHKIIHTAMKSFIYILKLVGKTVSGHKNRKVKACL